MAKDSRKTLPVLKKAPTGIEGFDEITFGGLPKGRPTLVAGAAGSGKTMFAMQFLVHGILEEDEPGVFMAFEEDPAELRVNFASLGIDLAKLEAEKKLAIDHVVVERSEFEESGEYDLEGLFVRLGFAIDSVGAKRVVLDTIETLFGGLPNDAILRAELHRLFNWLRAKGVTAIVTGESGAEGITRQGLEEYVSDCVVVLTHTVTQQISTRRLRVVKYRGSAHGTNDYPFLIDRNGLAVMPITSVGLEHAAFKERVSSGIPELDDMLGGEGYFRASSILVSGTAGTGKSSIGSAFVDAACRRGEKALFVSFEESEGQLIRNMESIGFELRKWADKGLLKYLAARPSVFGLEMHLVKIHQMVNEFDPSVVVIDPLSSLLSIGTMLEIQAASTRLIDFLKTKGVTAMFTSLVSGGEALEKTDEAVSSLADTWLLLRNLEYNGERNRTLYVLKSRGMGHSNQVREFVIDAEGLHLLRPYVGPAGVLTGSARVSQEAAESADRVLRESEVEEMRRSLERRRRALDARVEEMRAKVDFEEDELRRRIEAEELRAKVLRQDRQAMRTLRGPGDEAGEPR